MKKAFTINCMRKKEDFDGYFELIKKDIYQGIEIFYPYNVSEEQAKFYFESVNYLYHSFPNLEIVLHLPHGHLNSLTDEHLVNSYELMINAIEFAKLFEIKKLTLHLGSVKKDKNRNKYIEEIVEVLTKLCNYSSKYQMNIMIENMPSDNELGFSPSEILEIIEKVNLSNIKFILDTGHAFVSQYPLTDFVYTLQKYLYHLHFNDCDGIRDEHKRMHLGKIDFRVLFEALNDIQYQGLHCMEVIFNKPSDLVDFAKDLELYQDYYNK